MRRILTVCLFSLVLTGIAQAQSGATQSPDSLLSKFKADLLKAMKNFPNNPESRATSTGAARSYFEKMISDAQPGRPQLFEQVYSDLITNLGQASVFNDGNFQPERQMWIQSAYKTFETCVKYAKDKGQVKSTQACWDEFKARLVKISKQFTNTPDLRSEAEKGAKKIYDELINIAVDPPGTDALAAFNKNSAKADQVFPIDTNEQKQYNSSPNSLLRDAAKRAMDRSIQSQKK